MEANFNTNVNTNLETTHTIDISDRLYKITLAVIGVVGVFLAGTMVSQFQALPQNTPQEISVTGEGKAYVKPDVAMISLGVTSQASTSQEAVNQNNQKMTAIIKAVKDLGVEDKDIQTTSYNLSPVYGSDIQPMPAVMQDRAMGAGGSVSSSMIYPYPVPNNKITGYSLDQQVQVKIRNFDKINTILDAATASGANLVGSLYFTVDDMEKVKAEAREKAITQAKDKIKTLVKQTGLSVQKLVNVSEGYGYPVPYGMGGAMALDKAATVAPEIQPGQMEINTTVTLTYRVK